MIVTSKIMGQQAQVLESFNGSTVAELKAALGLEGNYTVNVGGQPANDSTSLSEGAFVVFAPSVKGAKTLATWTQLELFELNF